MLLVRDREELLQLFRNFRSLHSILPQLPLLFNMFYQSHLIHHHFQWYFGQWYFAVICILPLPPLDFKFCLILLPPYIIINPVLPTRPVVSLKHTLFVGRGWWLMRVRAAMGVQWVGARVSFGCGPPLNRHFRFLLGSDPTLCLCLAFTGQGSFRPDRTFNFAVLFAYASVWSYDAADDSSLLCSATSSAQPFLCIIRRSTEAFCPRSTRFV